MTSVCTDPCAESDVTCQTKYSERYHEYFVAHLGYHFPFQFYLVPHFVLLHARSPPRCTDFQFFQLLRPFPVHFRPKNQVILRAPVCIIAITCATETLKWIGFCCFTFSIVKVTYLSYTVWIDEIKPSNFFEG